MRYLITPTLLNDWIYFMSCDEPNPAEILAKIRKDRRDSTPAMEKGIKFENDVFQFVDGYRPGLKDEYWECVEEVAAMVPGGIRQLVVKKEILVDGVRYLLYGKVDHLAGPVGTDIKFTEHYEFPKYKDTAQHPVYLECLGTVPEFRYIISDGRRVYLEQYTALECPPAAQLVREFIGGIKRWPEAWETFDQKWRAYE
jgi:hypothetical protein